MVEAASKTVMRRTGAVCALLALLPLVQQLPASMLGLMGLILLYSFFLPKPPRWMLVLILLASLALLLLAFKGRFGRDTASCMLALMLAMKCLETDSMRDLRAVMGFSLFLPFAALLSSQKPLIVALALASMIFWMLLLQFTSTGELRFQFRRPLFLLKQQALQLALALPMAMALFWLFPRIATPLWGLPNLANQVGGLGDSMTPGQWLDSLADDRIAFRVTFTGDSPPPGQRYWRGPVLWDFDGKEWRRQSWDSLPVEFDNIDSADTNASIVYSVSLEPTERQYLPVLDWPRTAQAPFFLTQEASLYSDKPIQKLTQYNAESWTSQSPIKTLNASQRRRALALPSGLNPRSVALAKQWRQESVGERAYIDRVLQWINTDFRYTLATEEPGLNGADEFLFDQKEGFCQHFSSSFAVLMRAAGIPTRVVTGYAGGYKNPYGDYWVLYQKDAHAWNEVWLEGEGWVRIDPTAAVAPENILDTLTSSAGAESYFGERSLFSPLLDFSDFMTSRWNDWVIGFNAARQMDLLKGIGAGQLKQWQLLLALLVLSAMLSYALFYFWQHRKALPSDPVEAAWQKLMDAMRRYGIGKMAHETAADYGARFPSGLPFSERLRDASEMYSQWRYGVRHEDAVQSTELIAKLLELTKQVRRTGH
jgi:transglutaminase-like putative cysteine protease